MVTEPTDYQLDDNQAYLIEREAISRIGVGILLHKLDGSILFINRQAAAILDIDDLAGAISQTDRNIADLIMTTDSQQLSNAVGIRKRGVDEKSYEIRTVKGNRKWIRHLTNRMKLPCIDEEVFQAIIIDVTKNKDFENNIQASEALHRTVLNMTPTAIMVTDADGKIITLNASVFKLFRTEKIERFVGKDGFSFVHPFLQISQSFQF